MDKKDLTNWSIQKLKEEVIKVYAINFLETWCKMVKARNRKEAIKVFKDYYGTEPIYWDKKFTISLMKHESFYKDKKWLKTIGIFSGEGAKR